MNLVNFVNAPNLAPEGLAKAIEEMYRIIQDVSPVQRFEILQKVSNLCQEDAEAIRKECSEIVNYCDNVLASMSSLGSLTVKR